MATVNATLVDPYLGWYTRGGAAAQPVKWATGTSYNANEIASSQSGSSIKQPTPPQTDDNIRLTQYGTVIPRVAGTQLITVREPFWRSQVNAVPFQTGRTVKYNYFMDLAYIICVGPITGIYRVWEDGELRAQFGTAQNKLPGTLYLGNESQTADPVIAASEGAANTPAFRGVAYIVMQQHYLGESIQLPTFKFEVVKGTAF
jgi:hypothetical protein